jgi:TolA-binding protein
MIRKLISVAAIVMLCAGMAAAQEKMEQKESGLASWLKSMQKKLDIVNPRKTMPMTTGVAGVRGAKEDNGKGKLYWKGKKGDEQVTEAELKEFREGLAFAEAGDTASAVHEFEEFMSLYPDSPLIPDVKKTLDMVKAAPNAGARVEPKEETRAEAKTEAGSKPEPKAEPTAETK